MKAGQGFCDGIPERQDPIGAHPIGVAVLDANQLARDLMHRNPIAQCQTNEAADTLEVGLNHAASLGHSGEGLKRLAAHGIDREIHLPIAGIDRNRLTAHAHRALQFKRLNRCGIRLRCSVACRRI